MGARRRSESTLALACQCIAAGSRAPFRFKPGGWGPARDTRKPGLRLPVSVGGLAWCVAWPRAAFAQPPLAMVQVRMRGARVQSQWGLALRRTGASLLRVSGALRLMAGNFRGPGTSRGLRPQSSLPVPGRPHHPLRSRCRGPGRSESSQSESLMNSGVRSAGSFQAAASLQEPPAACSGRASGCRSAVAPGPQ